MLILEVLPVARQQRDNFRDNFLAQITAALDGHAHQLSSKSVKSFPLQASRRLSGHCGRITDNKGLSSSASQLLENASLVPLSISC